MKFIQILRGFAALAVLLFHLDIDTQIYFHHKFYHFDYGFLGVDFFFVLSGFIITYIHYKDIEERGSVKKFLFKRIIRIYPLYWLTLIVTILVMAPDFVEKPQLKEGLNPSTWIGLGNIIRNIFLLPVHQEMLPVGVSWTLIYEMVFYVMFAIAISVGKRSFKIILLLWVLLILINSRDIFPKSVITEFLAGNLIMEFLLGCFAAYLFIRSQFELNMKMFTAGVVIIILLCFAYLSWHPFNRYSIALTILMGSGAALVILGAATLDKRKKGRWLALPLLVLLGDASYSIYLTHNLYVPYLCKLSESYFRVSSMPVETKNLAIIGVTCISIAIGIVIHIYIEKPLLRVSRRKSKRLN